MKEMDDLIFYEWKMGDPCPVCGAKIPPTYEMMSHARSHNPPHDMVFLSRILYFHLKAPTVKEIIT